MKFQSLIAPIMHVSRSATSAALAVTILGTLNSCISLMAKKNTYGAAASSPGVRVNGANIRMQVKPQGTENGSYTLSAMVVSASVATFDGPFRWRLDATGEVGRQESLVVHRIRTRTAKTKRDEWYPVAHLEQRVEFKPITGSTTVTHAAYLVPGLLLVKPHTDGALEVFVDLTVTTQGHGERKLVCFRMDPSQKRQDEFIFLPTEIVKSIGKSTADWDESGWD